MPQVINTNVSSLVAQKNLDRSQGSLQTSLQRLSSGLRVNSAKDDAAGLAIATSITSQINGLDQARRNANDGISFAQVAEGALDEMTNMMLRMRTLAVQSASGTFQTADREKMDAEFSQLAAEIDRVIKNTEFNGVSSFAETYPNEGIDAGGGHPMREVVINVQVGMGTDDSDTISMTFAHITAASDVDASDANAQYGLDLFGGSLTDAASGEDGTARTSPTTTANKDIATSSTATDAIEALDLALEKVATVRATLGAAQSRFSSVVNGLANTIENLSAARGRIMDADFAVETASLTRSSILQQAGVSVLAQANSVPNNVLALLQ